MLVVALVAWVSRPDLEKPDVYSMVESAILTMDLFGRFYVHGFLLVVVVLCYSYIFHVRLVVHVGLLLFPLIVFALMVVANIICTEVPHFLLVVVAVVYRCFSILLCKLQCLLQISLWGDWRDAWWPGATHRESHSGIAPESPHNLLK